MIEHNEKSILIMRRCHFEQYEGLTYLHPFQDISLMTSYQWKESNMIPGTRQGRMSSTRDVNMLGCHRETKQSKLFF